MSLILSVIISVKIAVKENLQVLRSNPFAGKKFTGDVKGEFSSYRTGEYRIIYTTEKSEIFMETIGHRKDVYRKLKNKYNGTATERVGVEPTIRFRIRAFQARALGLYATSPEK